MCAANSSATICPDHDSLRAYLLGVLTGDDAELLDQHVSNCDSCIQAAQQLDADDELTDAIRSGKTQAGRDDDTVNALIDRLGRLREASASQPRDDTVTFDSSESVDDLAAPRLPHPQVPDFLAPAQQPDEIGRLGDYRILEILGAGGMGIVFRAEDALLKRIVAIKAMLPEIAAKENAKKRFLREAQATAAIEHDNIVTIYQVAEDRGTAFFAMQFLRGESLEDRIRRVGKLEDQEVLRIGREVAEGLTAAHAQGLLHRDIKPDNIWLEEGTGRVKIVDFGLARLDEEQDTQLTQSGAVLGTPKYMAPEQALGQEVDQRCDLFSLGSVLYRLTTGAVPFEGASVTATLISVANEDPRPIRELNPQASPALVAIIETLLQKKPDQRFQSADEVVAVIRQIECDLAAAAHEPTASLTPRISPPPARYRRVRVATVAVAVLAFLFGVIFLLRTPTGVLRIEVDDPNLTVLVDGTEIELTDMKWKGERTAEKHRLAIKLGDQHLKIGSPTVFALDGDGTEHQLSVKLNDISLSSDEFTIVRDEKNVLIVSFQPQSESLPVWPAEAPSTAIAPFEEPEAKAHQQAWADYLDLPVEKDVKLPGGEKMAFMLIPPGEFLMGSTDAERTRLVAMFANNPNVVALIPSEGPQHQVRITRPFYMGKYEVTQAQWQAVMGNNPARLKDPEHPVEVVTWPDIQAFLANLNGTAATETTSFALPTEAQWEYACRAGTTSFFHNGDDVAAVRELGWFRTNGRITATKAVGQYRPNPFGLYDMYGNVWEWCADWFAADYYGHSPVNDPSGPSVGVDRVNRGGCANDNIEYCRSASRFNRAPDRAGLVGFRLAMTFETAKISTSLSQSAASKPIAANGLRFDGDTSYVRVPSFKYDGNHPLTVEAIVTPEAQDAASIVSAFNYGGYRIYVSQGRWHAGIHCRQKVNLGTDEVLVPNQRIHLALVYDGKQVSFFVDGKSRNSEEVIGDYRPPRDNIDLFLGADAHNNTGEAVGFFLGDIHQVRFSKAALYSKDFIAPTKLEKRTDTLALYRLDEASGDVAHDSSGNEHHGEIHAATWVAHSTPPLEVDGLQGRESE